MDPTNPSTSSNSTSIYTNPALDPNDPDIFFNDDPKEMATTNAAYERRRVPPTTEEVKALLDFEGPTVDTPMPLLEEYKKERARKRAEEDALEAEELKAKMANAPIDQVELEPAAMDAPIPEDAAMFAFNALTMLAAQLPQPAPVPAFNGNFQQGNLFFLDLRTSDLSGFNYQLFNFGNIGILPLYSNSFHYLLGIFNPNVNIFNFAAPPPGFSMQSDDLGNLNVNIQGRNGQEARGSEGPSTGPPSEHLTHSDTLDEMQASRPTTVNTMFSALTSPMVSPGLDNPASHYGTLPIQMFLPTQTDPIVPQPIPEAPAPSLPVHTAQEPVLEAPVVPSSILPMQQASSSTNGQIVPKLNSDPIVLEPVVMPPVNQTIGKKYITTSGTWHIPKDPAAEASSSGSSTNGSETQIKDPAVAASPIVVPKSPDAPEPAGNSSSSSADSNTSGRKRSSEDPSAAASPKITKKDIKVTKSPDVPEAAGTSSSSSSGSSANGSAIRNEDPAVAVSPFVVPKSPDALEAAGTCGCSPAGPIASGNQRSSEDPVVAVSLMTITTKKQNIVVLKSHDAPEAARTSDSSSSGSSFNGSEKHIKDSAAAASTKKANVVLKSPVTPEAARISSSFSSDSITSGKNRSSEDLAATAPPKTVTTKKPTMVLKSPDVPEAARTSASSSAGPIAFGKKRSSDDPIATTSTPKNVRFTDFLPRPPPPPPPPPRYNSEAVFQMAPRPSAALSSRAQSSSSIPSQLFDRRHDTTHVGTPAPKTPITSQGYHLPATRIVPIRQETPMESPRSRTGSSALVNLKPKVMKILTSGPEFEKMKAEFLEYSESQEYKKAMGYLQVFNCLIDASDPIDRFPKSVSNVPGINRLREWAQASGNVIPNWRVRDRRDRIVKVQDHMIKMNWVVVKTVAEQKREEKEKPKKEKPVKKEKRGQKRSAARVPTFAENAQAHNDLRRRLNDREAATSSGMFSPTSSFIR